MSKFPPDLLFTMFRVGNGVDVHAVVKDRKLILGGVHIEHDYGCDGHSDGDVLVHSIIDAILGALGKGDIGDHFPSSNNKLKGIRSITLLEDIYTKYIINKWDIANIDSTIILQKPIIKPYVEKMKKNLNFILLDHLSMDENISIKATTTDHLGFIGEEKGIAAITTCLLIKHND